jgi:hypothetical protein
MDDNGPTTRLVDTKGSHAPYIALSYTWGDSPTVRVNSTTLGEYKNEVDVSTLPRHVSDAVRFTRNMGLKYLWVDYLCINKDDPTEVSEELDRFVDYYSNSSMVICALQPYSSISRLKWKPNQRLDIPPYSILRSGTLGDALADRSWVRASLLQESCFKPNGKRTIPLNYRDDSGSRASFQKKQMPQFSYDKVHVSESSGIHTRRDTDWRIWLNLVAGTSRIVDYASKMLGVLIESMLGVVNLGKDNPWVVCCVLCVWFAGISFYLGTCMATIPTA